MLRKEVIAVYSVNRKKQTHSVSKMHGNRLLKQVAHMVGYHWRLTGSFFPTSHAHFTVTACQR